MRPEHMELKNFITGDTYVVADKTDVQSVIESIEHNIVRFAEKYDKDRYVRAKSMTMVLSVLKLITNKETLMLLQCLFDIDMYWRDHNAKEICDDILNNKRLATLEFEE